MHQSPTHFSGSPAPHSSTGASGALIRASDFNPRVGHPRALRSSTLAAAHAAAGESEASSPVDMAAGHAG